MHLLLDPANADVRVEFGMAEAEYAQRAQWRASAQVFRAIDETLREATSHPEVFLGFSRLSGRDAVEYSVRSAIADLAQRLHLGEGTVRSHGHIGGTLRERTPQVWAWFQEGEVSTQNAREVADLVTELPAEVWAAFDEQVVDPAKTLAPARFRTTARTLRERLDAESLEARHQRARGGRHVSIDIERDGVGWLHAQLPIESLAKIGARLDDAAIALFAEPDESRTMSQLRADVLVDLINESRTTPTVGVGAVGVTVALTVPILSLLGQSIEPAMLEGVGPIDLDTARRLCGDATSFTRLLTDPISGAILTMDAQQYRPTAAQKRWLGIRDVTCDFPGCGRRASGCDIDHIVDWAHGGATTAENLHHLCRKHHTMKHQTRWRVDKPPGQPPIWTSPTGYVRGSDPPPY